MRSSTVFILVSVVVLIGFGVAVSLVSRDSSPSKTAQNTKPQTFTEKTSRVRFTTDGAVVGLERHQAIRITVDQSTRTVEVLRGYNGQVERSQNLANDHTAFKRFLTALNSNGYTIQDPEAAKSEGGTCSLGLRYIYEATYNRGAPLRSWSSSCGKGSFGGATSVRLLFQNQIPDYNKFVSGVRLTSP